MTVCLIFLALLAAAGGLGLNAQNSAPAAANYSAETNLGDSNALATRMKYGSHVVQITDFCVTLVMNAMSPRLV